MKHNKRTKNTLFKLISLFLLGLVNTAMASSSDHQKPIHIQADQATYDYQKRIIYFNGNASITQGTTQLSGEHITVYKDQANGIKEIIAKGHYAHYHTLLDDDPHQLNARALSIRYYPKKQRAILDGDGEVIKGENQLKAPHIVYYIDSQKLTTQPSGHQRTKIVIAPQETANTPTTKKGK